MINRKLSSKIITGLFAVMIIQKVMHAVIRMVLLYMSMNHISLLIMYMKMVKDMLTFQQTLWEMTVQDTLDTGVRTLYNDDVINCNN